MPEGTAVNGNSTMIYLPSGIFVWGAMYARDNLETLAGKWTASLYPPYKFIEVLIWTPYENYE